MIYQINTHSIISKDIISLLFKTGLKSGERYSSLSDLYTLSSPLFFTKIHHIGTVGKKGRIDRTGCSAAHLASPS